MAEFTIDLGNGVHLDSTGALTSGPSEGKAAFSLSAALPIPGEALQQAFSGLKTVFPKLDDIAKDISLIAKFQSLGLSENLISTFSKVAQIAETLASVIPVVNIAAGILSMLGSFGAPNPIEDLIKQEFTRLFARLDEQRRDDLQNLIIDPPLAAFHSALADVDGYHTALSQKFHNPGELEGKLRDLDNERQNVQQNLIQALLHTWSVPLDPLEYSTFWPASLMNRMFTVPAPGQFIPAVIPDNSEPFDHRPMVQLLVFGIHTYLTMIKTIAPAHRTTGQYSTALRGMADKLSDQLAKMRSQTLARTIYQAGVPEFLLEQSRQFFILPVGAGDLRTDTQDYMNSVQTQTSANYPSQWRRYGNLNTAWSPPPSVDIRGPETQIGLFHWRSISPLAVELANKQSERDYALTLTRSGYFTLAHLEALFRHLSTEPDKSETVSAKSEVWHRPLPATAVTVRSADIPLSAPFEVRASRQPQECEAYLFLTTQPVLHNETIGYRLRWVTLANGTTETPFEDYVRNEYREDDGPRNWKLVVNENSGIPLDAPQPNDDVAAPNKRFFMDGPSPPLEEIRQQGTVQLTADTFDWYIPVPDNPILLARLSAAGWAAVQPSHVMAPHQTLPSGWVVSKSVQEEIISAIGNGVITSVGPEPDDKNWTGERREWHRGTIEITYDLHWAEDQLTISFKTRPQDRNYVIYLVVEEYLARSNQWLRTPVRIQTNGQRTYVPQSFFDAEGRARKYVDDVIDHIERSYVISKQPGPSDPVTNSLRPGPNSVEDMQQFLRLAEAHAPELVAQAIAQTNRRQ